MKFPSKDIIERLRAQYPQGSTVVLDHMDDEQAPPIGMVGTVIGVDDAGSIMVKWQNGCGLNVVYGVDRCHVADQKELALMKINELATAQRAGDCCPRCGMVMHGRLHAHALSRRADITVCDQCGMTEALEDAGLVPALPINEWEILRN